MAGALIPVAASAVARTGIVAGLRGAFTALGSVAGRALSWFGLGKTAYDATVPQSGSYSGGSTLAGGRGSSTLPTPLAGSGGGGGRVTPPAVSSGMGLPANRGGQVVTIPAPKPIQKVPTVSTAAARASNASSAAAALPASLVRYNEMIAYQDSQPLTGLIRTNLGAGLATGSALSLGDVPGSTNWAKIGLIIAAGAAAVLAVKAVRRG